jgi:hypothetical protein
MNCIIIADKPFKGIKSKGWSGLLQINKTENLIDNQIKVIKKSFPGSKIFYIYGFEHKKVEDYLENNNQNIVPVYNENYDTFGQLYSLSLISHYLNENTLIFFGDIILKPSVFKDLNKKYSQLYVKKNYSDLGCVINSKNEIEQISYNLENYISEIYYFKKEDLQQLQTYTKNYAFRNYFLFEIVNRMIDQGMKLRPKKVLINNYFNNITKTQKGQ